MQIYEDKRFNLCMENPTVVIIISGSVWIVYVRKQITSETIFLCIKNKIEH